MVLGPPRQCAHDRLVEAVNQATAGVRDQPNFTGQTGLETHSRSSRNVQTISKSSLPIEGESRVAFSKMIVAADLDRPVACVGNRKRNICPIHVQNDLAGCWKNLAGYHGSPAIKAIPPNTVAPPMARKATLPIDARRKAQARCPLHAALRWPKQNPRHKERDWRLWPRRHAHGRERMRKAPRSLLPGKPALSPRERRPAQE